MTTWETLSAEYGGSTRKGPNEKSAGECQDSLNAMVILQYCSGTFRIEDVAYSDLRRSSSTFIAPMRGCGHNPQNSGGCRKLAITKRTETEQTVSGELNVETTGSYRFVVRGTMRGTPFQFSETTGKKSCGAKEDVHRIVTVPYRGSMEDLPGKEIQAWEPVLASLGDPGTLQLPARVMAIWPYGFQASGSASGPKGNVIRDRKSLPPTRGADPKAPCYACTGTGFGTVEKRRLEQERTATWFFTTDPCEYAKRELEGARKIKDTYEKMRSDAQTKNMDGEAFNSAVTAKLIESGFAPSAPMATDPASCLLRGDPQQIRKEHYECFPQVTFDADRAHEAVHQKTCSDRNGGRGSEVKNPGGYSNYLNDKGNYASDEIAAYDKKIEVLENWLAGNCR